MGKLLLIGTWIPSTLISIFASIFLLHYLTHVQGGETLLRMKTQEVVVGNQFQFFAALPKVLGTFSSTISTGDARPEIVRTFLRRYDSPLATHADYIVDIADEYGIDYRMIPAIAMQESNGCKYIPEDSYNCWGYGIYGDKVLRFSDYKQGIKTVAKGLRSNYLDDGLTTPDTIMARYTPQSRGSWAFAVNHFMEKMQ